MMEQYISCRQSNQEVAAAQSRELNPAEQIELICLNDEEFLKGYISDNRFDAEVEKSFVEFGKIAMILFYRRIHGLTEAAKQIFNLRFGNLL